MGKATKLAVRGGLAILGAKAAESIVKPSGQFTSIAVQIAGAAGGLWLGQKFVG